MTENTNARPIEIQEFSPRRAPGIPVLILNTLALLISILIVIAGGFLISGGSYALGGVLIAVGFLYACVFAPAIYSGLKTLKPNEALVFTLFGKYAGTLRGAGFFFVNPFMSATTPAVSAIPPAFAAAAASVGMPPPSPTTGKMPYPVYGKKISLKALTLSNDQQKINDQLGNPIIVGIVVVWRVVNAAMAVFNVDNYCEFLSIQSDAALRNIAREYPYDFSGDDDDEKTLRGSSLEISERLKTEIQAQTRFAGLEILEARITHLSYAPEIAAAMLQRQQASAIIDARKLIVEGAVGMVEMALSKLGERGIVDLDDERRAAMVSNLLVVLCGNRDAQPIVNSGSIY
ncbi:MAG: SPFH domain-containing protein [Oscillospiraceae bacterium]|jgi:regulator of protease activity HflC (stomatin/prohibitin superfamily)|nr:SPFH domain-containing protein [Oscillospiraceae bacterium]